MSDIRLRARTRAVVVATGLALTLGLVSGCAPEGQQVAVDAPAQTEAKLAGDTQTQLEAAVQSAMTATGSTGAIVGVWVPWAGTWVSTVGTDVDGKKLDVNMGVRVGEITRLMTCDVLYSVAADGTVKLDDPISNYVAGVPDLENVTLKNLCDGSSGLGTSSTVLAPTWLSNPTRIWEPLELAAHGLAQARATPGSTYRDSDAGFILLGLALERATGETFATLLEERVFAPLGMENSAYPPATELTANVGAGPMPGYVFPRNAEGALECTAPREMSEVSATMGFSSAGVVATTEDVGRYLQALGVNALGRGDVAEQRWATPLTPYASAPDWYTVAGGGLQAGTLVGQIGSTPGALTAGFVDRETGMTVVVVLNNSTAGSDMSLRLAWELAAIASKAPAASGQTAPAVGLPWTAEQWGDSITASALVRP